MTLGGVLIGLGRMGRFHHRVLAAMPDVNMHTIDTDPARGADERSLKTPARRYDFACVAVPAARLADVAHWALEHSDAVLIEKPLATSVADAEEIIRHATQRDALLSVGYVERFNPAVQELRDRLAQAGPIWRLHTRRLSPAPAKPANIILDLATHDIDIIGALVGRAPLEILALGEERMVCATMRYPSGAIATIEANYITPAKVRELTITGEAGMFALNYGTQELCFYEQPDSRVCWDALAGVRGPREGNMTRYAFERREPLVLQWEAFLRALRNGWPAPVPARDALATLRTAQAIEGCTVRT